jgi:hypothetical protein
LDVEYLEVYSILGQRIEAGYFTNQKEVIIDTSSWGTGIYLVTVRTNDGYKKSLKIVKY